MVFSLQTEHIIGVLNNSSQWKLMANAPRISGLSQIVSLLFPVSGAPVERQVDVL